jgi:uncharacterized protein (DUF4415 family)
MIEKRRGLGSDLAKIDAHKITDEEYEEIPEVTEEWFEKADLYEGDKLIRRGRPPTEAPKQAVSIRLSPDVLEHFRDTSILERAKQWLKPGGQVVASTGNIALWFMRLALLSGRFQYTPRGILDETHAKLYTHDSFHALIKQAGYNVTHEDYSVIPIEKLVQSVPSLEKAVVMFDSLQYALARSRPELFAYQFVLQAQPV